MWSPGQRVLQAPRGEDSCERDLAPGRDDVDQSLQRDLLGAGQPGVDQGQSLRPSLPLSSSRYLLQLFLRRSTSILNLAGICRRHFWFKPFQEMMRLCPSHICETELLPVLSPLIFLCVTLAGVAAV